MKVGDYVRNKYGIAKVIDIENNNGIDILVFDKSICFLVNKETGKIKDDRLLNRLAIIDGVDVSKIKSSPNIIDLIEVGDILKLKDVKHYQEVQFIDKEKLYLSEFIYMSGLQKYKKEIEEDLEWIITCEQIESMKYKIGE